MSVILSKDDFRQVGFGQRHAQPCFHCGGPCHYPFTHWDGEPELFICTRCCAQIKAGLMADLVQVAANLELINLGYRDALLVRESTTSLNKRLSRAA
jgi:hypothetical protein